MKGADDQSLLAMMNGMKFSARWRSGTYAANERTFPTCIVAANLFLDLPTRLRFFRIILRSAKSRAIFDPFGWSLALLRSTLAEVMKNG
jgi:hypothetical protein